MQSVACIFQNKKAFIKFLYMAFGMAPLGLDIHGPERVNPTDFGYPLTFPV